MEIYETEEEQVAALKDWWKANGSSVISGVVIAAIAIGGWNFWQSYQQGKVNQASAMYEQLLQAQTVDNAESVDKIATNLQAEFGSTAYGAYGLLFQAKEKVKQNDLSAAKAIFEQAIAATDDTGIKHVARTRLIRVLLAQKEYEQGLQVIANVDQSSLDGFASIYDELKGDLYVAMGRVGEARTAYQSALQTGQSSPLLQFKLDDLTAADSAQG
ncbi:MAG: tetratricopeptide repeat protein [Methylococcaceae bacterium]|nr:tetratricopeptide repeat protein [Methylococcaceae bacterium]